MQEIQSITINIKVNDDHADKFYLIHNGKQVIGFGGPGVRAAVPDKYTMLVGTKDELEAEISKLKLAPKADVDRLPKPNTTRDDITDGNALFES